MHMNNIKIENPYLGFIAIPLVIVVIVGFFLLPKYKRKSTKNLISLGMHFLMIVTLTLTFMDIQFIHTSKDTELLILADCSESTRQQSEKLDETIQDIYQQGKEKGDKVGIVCFGGNTQKLVDIGGSYKKASEVFDATKYPEFDTTTTDIQSALDYSKDLFDEESVKRIVIVSDGKETDGSAIDSLEALINSSITVDSVLLNENVGDEIALTGLEYTDHCFVNKNQTLKASIYSYSQATAKLELDSNGEAIVSQEVNVNKGLNVFTLDLPSDKAGTFDYEVKVTSLTGNADKYEENNVKKFEQDFTDEIKVLLLANEPSDLDALKKLGVYSEKTEIDPYYDQSEFPYTLDDLMKYDEIILSDINVGNMQNGQEFVSNLQTVVKYYGKSVITYGATYSAQSEDFIKNYNDMLPVQYESDEPKALALLIDVSYSMEGDKMKQAKAGAIACLDLLGEQDYVSVVTFSDNVKVVVPLMPAKNKTKIIESVSKIDVQGGTTMLPGLKQCEDLLSSAQFEFKNVITLSDGMPFDTESELRTQVIKMSAKNISCSFINIANPSGSSLLTKLSVYGNGTYYYAKDAKSIVSVITSSVSDEITNKSIDTPSLIQVREKDDTSLKEVDTGSLPSVEGFNYCRMKSAAKTVLTVQYVNESSFSSISTIPLYAYWDFGNGRVSSFTSSLSGDWTSDLRASSQGKKFFLNATNDSLPKRKVTNNIDFTYKTKGKTTEVNVTSNDGDKSAKVTLKVTDPNGNETTQELAFDGTSYTGEVATQAIGKYTCDVEYVPSIEGQKTVNSTYPMYFDYSSEYDFSQGQDNTLMYELSKQNGNYFKGKYTLNTLDSELEFKSYRSTMVYFLLATVILFLIDVLIRKKDFKKKKKTESKEVGSFN